MVAIFIYIWKIKFNVSPISKESTETIQWTPIDEAALVASSVNMRVSTKYY